VLGKTVRDKLCQAALLLAALIGFTGTAAALDPARPINHYRHEIWQEEQGLPQYTVNSIAQSRDGYIWLGTYHGLVRFDGVEFKVFDQKNTPEIKEDRIWSMCEDTSGTLWVGTSRGLTTIREGRFGHREVRPELGSEG
jgi:ligand-binding sensor domain-containing protein